jgi:uncharacterized repeat protein (TIGR01451 family)
VHRLTALTAATLVVLCLAGAAPPWGDSGASAATRSGPPAQKILVTIAARSCPSYPDITANLARNNIQESLQDLGADTLYRSGEPISYSLELEGQPNCTPLPNWRFTLGRGYRSRAVTGSWGALSIVTDPFPTSIVTRQQTPLLDPRGNPTGREIAGAVTIELDATQAELASRPNRLWLQGGTTTDPVLDQQFPQQYGFGALRCAIDNLNGDNVEWIGFPEGATHVFCYAYYVKPPPTSGTIIVRKEISEPAGASQPFRFEGNISYASDGSFTLDVNNGVPRSETFYRAETVAGDAPWSFREVIPPGWKLEDIRCTSKSGRSAITIDQASARTTVSLAASDIVTCTYVNRQIPPTGGLALAKTTIGGIGTFEYTVTPVDGGTSKAATATTSRPGVEVAAVPDTIELAPGRYRIAEKLPSSPTGRWKLSRIECNGESVAVANPITITITAGEGTLCRFENRFKPNGSIIVRKVMRGNTGTVGFSISRKTAVYSQTATVEKENVAVRARGDDTTSLALGTYRIQELAIGGRSTAGWVLSSVSCNGKVIGFAQGAIEVKLTKKAPQMDCTFTNTYTAAPPVTPPQPPGPPDPEANIVVKKTADRTSVRVGERVTYTIIVTNTGTGTAQEVVVAEQTPGSATIVSVQPSQGSCVTRYRPASCNLGSIAPGAAATIIVVLRPTRPGTMVNGVAVGTATVDPDEDSEGDEVGVTVRPKPKPLPPRPPFAG